LCGTEVLKAQFTLSCCAFAVGFWHWIGVQIEQGNVTALWCIRTPSTIPNANGHFYILS